MVAFYGDYDLTETVNIPFNTFSSDDPSASVTVTDWRSETSSFTRTESKARRPGLP